MDLKALNVFVFHRQAQEFMPLLPLGCDFRSPHWADYKKVMHFIKLIILTEKKIQLHHRQDLFVIWR